MARVWATCDIGSEALALVRRAGHDVDWWADLAPVPHAEIVRAVADGCDALITTLRDRIDREVIEAGRGRLRVIAQDAVGLDNVDLAAATEAGIVVTNTPDVLTEATAEFALFMLGAAARRLEASERLVREGRWGAWHPWHPLLGDEVTGKAIAVVGCGRIGRSFAGKCTGLDADLLLVGRVEERWLEALRKVQRARHEGGLARRLASCEVVPLDDALARADFVSLHVPLVKEGPRATLRLIGERELKLMKPTAWLVNTARGPVVDEAALVTALRAGTIAGAALDVFEREPLPLESPLLAEDLRVRVRVFHHFGSGTRETRLSPDAEVGMAGRTAWSVIDALSASPTWRHAVNRPRS